jgi:hypothetical protein
MTFIETPSMKRFLMRCTRTAIVVTSNWLAAAQATGVRQMPDPYIPAPCETFPHNGPRPPGRRNRSRRRPQSRPASRSWLRPSGAKAARGAKWFGEEFHQKSLAIRSRKGTLTINETSA